MKILCCLFCKRLFETGTLQAPRWCLGCALVANDVCFGSLPERDMCVLARCQGNELFCFVFRCNEEEYYV